MCSSESFNEDIAVFAKQVHEVKKETGFYTSSLYPFVGNCFVSVFSLFIVLNIYLMFLCDKRMLKKEFDIIINKTSIINCHWNPF